MLDEMYPIISSGSVVQLVSVAMKDLAGVVELCDTLTELFVFVVSKCKD